MFKESISLIKTQLFLMFKFSIIKNNEQYITLNVCALNTESHDFSLSFFNNRCKYNIMLKVKDCIGDWWDISSWEWIIVNFSK